MRCLPGQEGGTKLQAKRLVQLQFRSSSRPLALSPTPHLPVSLGEEFNAGTAMWQVVGGWLVGWLAVVARCTLHVALTRMIAIVDWKYTVDSNARNPLAVIIPSVLVALIVLCRWTCAVGSSTSRTNVCSIGNKQSVCTCKSVQ